MILRKHTVARIWFCQIHRHINTRGSLDVASMSAITKAFILEVMGRHAGWLAAAELSPSTTENLPQIILLPERPLQKNPS